MNSKYERSTCLIGIRFVIDLINQITYVPIKINISGTITGKTN